MSALIHYRKLNGYKYATTRNLVFDLRWTADDSWTGKVIELAAPTESNISIDGWVGLNHNAELNIRPGYAWDGPSGPSAWPGLVIALGAVVAHMGLGIPALTAALVLLAALLLVAAAATRDSSDLQRASLVHDALYQLCRDGMLDYTVYQSLSDQVLRQLALEDGMNRLRAAMLYWGLKRFGAIYARPQDHLQGELEHVAPRV